MTTLAGVLLWLALATALIAGTIIAIRRIFTRR